ncbi:hypothetical protein DFH28DRAFT_1082841 [Melampsora americana]|nr:hypothetical protein DFH28DRAFT_1082841 [Melampsora americana]
MAAACPKAGTPCCYNCGADGHISKDCSSAPVPKNCYNCGESGHIVESRVGVLFVDAYDLVCRVVIVLNSPMVTLVAVEAAVEETAATFLALVLKLANQVAATEAIINQDEVAVAITVTTTATVVVEVPIDPATHVVEGVIYLETAFKHKNASIAVKSVTLVEIAPNPNQRPATTYCNGTGHISKDCPTAPSGDGTAA